MVNSKAIKGGLSQSGIRSLLVQSVTGGLQSLAGYKPPVMPVTLVTHLIPRALVLVRNKPVFHMSCGHVDFAVDYLREHNMPCQLIYITKRRKQADGTWKQVIVASNSIQEFVEGLRKYVNRIDAEYHKAMERDSHDI